MYFYCSFESTWHVTTSARQANNAHCAFMHCANGSSIFWLLHNAVQHEMHIDSDAHNETVRDCVCELVQNGLIVPMTICDLKCWEHVPVLSIKLFNGYAESFHTFSMNCGPPHRIELESFFNQSFDMHSLTLSKMSFDGNSSGKANIFARIYSSCVM